MNQSTINYSLYLVTNQELLEKKDLLVSIEEAIKGGVTLVQLREKNKSSMDFYHLAKKVKELTDRYDIPLIINDRLDIALAVDAAGVHLGPDDLPVSVARKIVGPNKLIGASTCNLQEALQAQKDGANYLGVGAMFPTKTKNDTEDVSIEELSRIKSSISLPVVAIGGINEINAPTLLKTGINGIAVISAILSKDNVLEAAKTLSSIITKKNLSV